MQSDTQTHSLLLRHPHPTPLFLRDYFFTIGTEHLRRYCISPRENGANKTSVLFLEWNILLQRTWLETTGQDMQYSVSKNVTGPGWGNSVKQHQKDMPLFSGFRADEPLGVGGA